MAQHDYVIANGTGAAVRSDLNNALAAIVSQNSGAVAPTTTYAYMPWADTGSSPPVYKIRNAANNGWITLYELDGTFSVEAGSASSPGLYFTGDINTGIYSPGADQFGISTGGTSRLTIDASGNINMDSGTVYVDAANNRLGIGTTTPGGTLQLGDGTGSPDLVINKSEGGDGTIRFNKAGSASAAIQYDGTESLIYYMPSGTGSQVFYTSNVERARIDSSGRLLVGTSSARSNFFNTGSLSGLLQIEGLGNTTRVCSFIHNTSDIAGPLLVLGKSRGTTAGANTVVVSGDELGVLSFQGADGSELVSAAEIRAEVDGTPGANDMPGRLVFSTTADGASSPTERMRIMQNGGTSFFATANNVDAIDSCHNQGAGTTVSTFIGRHSATGVTSGTVSVRIYTNGNIQNTNNSYGSLSDIKLKENIVDAGSQWNDLKALQVRKYNLKEGQTHTQIGLIAQEAELVSPGLVYETPDRDEDGNETGEFTKGVNYSVLYMKAVKALQEAMERIEVLEQRLTDAGIA